MKRIGLIGAGIMASGMAVNFLKAKYPVMIWNRSYSKLEPLLDVGAINGSSPKEVTNWADIVIECVSDDQASRSVWLGDNGILAAANRDKVLIASSSLSLDWIDELAGNAIKQGYQFMDMPLTGSRVGAENGTLRLLVGGSEVVLDSIREQLKVISEKIYYFGPAGSGMRFKLMLNSLIGIHMNAAAQAQSLAQKAGIDPESFAQALIDGSMGPASPSTKLVFESKKWPEGKVNFSAELLEKDLKYAQAMASKYNFNFDLLNDTHHDYSELNETNSGLIDVTAIGRLFK